MSEKDVTPKRFPNLGFFALIVAAVALFVGLITVERWFPAQTHPSSEIVKGSFQIEPIVIHPARADVQFNMSVVKYCLALTFAKSPDKPSTFLDLDGNMIFLATGPMVTNTGLLGLPEVVYPTYFVRGEDAKEVSITISQIVESFPWFNLPLARMTGDRFTVVNSQLMNNLEYIKTKLEAKP